ncbi:MBL fold metallo-hydrolase [Flagellatimonas centrodinii]|jgi:glyoxylase-like metal-dependent hydrolase (beta-lactamase superfamily II)|uniref:MBL fold metallo-hydrolase n=1 Tax=Flagellatimonas centrodinii TaxID=2806210 RepID=UPI001FEFADCA|nr:MBL fold metallo-hydrolase [Flagellatimonas centrodinii]ULQ46287.1 MBL fold metallo-hydrolase [Flagellatimonas centrodinii]
MPLHNATLIAIALAALLTGCAESPPPPAPVQAETEAAFAPAAHPDVHRFAIGQYAAIVLRDGDIRVPNDGSVVAQGVPKAETDALLAAAGQPTDTLHLAVQSLLVDLGDRVVLFDTGAGDAAFADAGRLPQSLLAAGVDAAGVTDIVISHAHGDHVGGLLDGNGQLAFANATVRLSAPEWQALQDDAGMAALAEAIAPRVEVFEPGANVLPGVASLPVEGHTPGHSAYVIADGDQRLLYIGDTAHHHVISVQRPRWTIQFDGDAPVAEDSREALLARIADEGWTMQSPHFPFPGLGRIERRDDSFAWVPLD